MTLQCALTSTLQTAAKVAGLAFLLLLIIALYRLTLHPLARVPGPKVAALSNAWLALRVRDGRMLELGKEIHKRYGPVVRVGPNEVWCDSMEAFAAVYTAGNGVEKSDFYLATKLNKPIVDWRMNLHWPDTLDFLSEFDTKRYRLQRRLIGPTYQTANLKKFESAIDAVIAQAIQKLKSLDGAEVDLKQWMHIVAVECLGAVVLSWSPGYIRDGTDGGTSTQSYLGWRRKSVFGLFPLATKLSFFSKGMARQFSNLWGVTFSTPKNFKPFFTPVYQKSSKRIAAALRADKSSVKDARKDLLADLIQLHKDRPEFTETYLRRLAVTNFGAGHETMCSALTSIMTMIGSHPGTAEEIRNELPSDPQIISHDDALRLRYTQACIKEAQRLHPVIGMSLPRRAPVEGLSLHGYYIPPGTTVGCNPVSLHRNPHIFGPKSDDYLPDRWLDADPEMARAMERCNLTWGGGARMCPGRHLAEMVLYKVVPALIKEFDVDIVAMPRHEEVKYYFMAMLTGVTARFVPVDKREPR
ncbi:cytochrome P450 [Podospora aff. communis PSN243]|uniref:Cytochrome P450 n=1 Tax=Podospora aff. communis PSN243 TaxID=3040156 RepID=A0AAV9G5B7_9PEZI|nr:cytochrome P450 [Podospora aff. communis PSN243]